MKNIVAVAKYQLVRMARDWRLMVMILSQPIVIAVVVGFMAYQEPDGMKIAVANTIQSKYSQKLVDELRESDGLNLTELKEGGKELVLKNGYRAVVIIDVSPFENSGGSVKVYSDPVGGIASLAAKEAISKAVSTVARDMAKEQLEVDVNSFDAKMRQNLPSNIAAMLPQVELDDFKQTELSLGFYDATDFDLQHFDYYASAIMVLLVFLVVLNTAGISITSDREKGTFERLSVTPFTKTDIIMGNALSQFVIGLSVIIIGMLTLKLVFAISIGSFWLLSLLSVICVACAVNLGLLISAITKTVVESVELAMYAFFMAVLTCGIITPSETAHGAYLFLKKYLPFSYAVTASREINMMNANWQDIASDIYVLIVFTVIFMISAIWALRRGTK
ncbi:MAG: Inner membrane transport permease YbhR [bacterium ADurb.Bin212]|nr:MAG: Inner membrane transport permease YbhR [bacterium ADurb.Bin212]